jgi:hypothetical protein
MEKSNFALRLLPSLHKAAQRIAERENCSVNQLINLALAEKIAVLDADYWRERKKTAASRPKSEVLKLLGQLGGNEPPREGDELPPGFKATKLPAKRKGSYMRATS